MPELNEKILLSTVGSNGGCIRFLDLESKLREQGISFSREDLGQLVSRLSRFGSNFKLVYSGIFINGESGVDIFFSLPMAEIQKLPLKSKTKTSGGTSGKEYVDHIGSDIPIEFN